MIRLLSSKSTLLNLAIYSSLALVLFVLHDLVLSAHGKVGADYEYFIPRLWEGIRFFQAHGFQAPLYSPALCGGIPFFANPQSIFYSFPQIASLVLDVWTAIRLTLALFIGIGVAGTYLLARQVFRIAPLGALIAGLFFGTNGWFVSRMLIGHLSFHGVQLAPFLCIGVLSPCISTVSGALLTGLVGGYLIHSGGYYSAQVAMASTAIVTALAYSVPCMRIAFRTCVVRSCVGLMIMLLLGAGKVVLAHDFISHFPRGVGFESMPSLSATVTMIAAQLWLFGDIQPVDHGFWEFDATLNCLSLFGLFCAVKYIARQKHLFYRASPWVVATLAVMVVGVVTLIHGPEWLIRTQKYIPLLNSCRLNLRYTAAFMLPIALVAAWGLTLDRSPRRLNVMVILTFVTGAIVPLRFLALDTQFMRSTSIQSINAADKEIRGNSSSNQHLEVRDEPVPWYRSSLIEGYARGETYKNCYEPLFTLTNPSTKLRVGTVENGADSYNLLKAACTVYPEENTCSPGDLITRRDELDAFLNRSPNLWLMPSRAHIALKVSTISFYLCIATLLIQCLRGLRRKRIHS